MTCTTPAQAAAPQSACELMYSGNIETYAMTCSEPGEPMFGGFATWRNIPVKFDQVDTQNKTVTFSNYLRLTPNTEASPFENNIEVGLYAEKTGKTTQTYGPRWTELGNSGGKTKAITAGVNPSVPDGRNHTYMLMRKSSGDQWDVLYDFNTVGSTTDQLKVIPGSTNRIDTGMELLGHQYTDVPEIANRMQFMDGNNTWRQVATKNTATIVTLPACSTTNKPPNCLNTKLADATSFSQWTVSKPRTAITSTLQNRKILGMLPTLGDTHNGVDQSKLQACMENEPDRCLDDVPGLAECVRTHRVCNTSGLTSEPAIALKGAAEAGSESIRQRAASAFNVATADIEITAAVEGSSGEGEKVWDVQSTHSTPGLRDTGKLFKGFHATYSAKSGEFLEACWGDMCKE
ncbi:hypothetical protein ACF08M_05790 [Streptomyces sp. NPDC015032]|uniref:hypothetical protein n=1 Tax=Streptomyces sp. NPDC015032 TaxID=3364937 RepID=UPI0036FE4B49